MKRTHIALLFAIFFSATVLCAQSHRLTLDVVGMKEKKGNLLISVYDSAEDYRLPTEPCGFSRDARPKMGPPRYKPACFTLSEDTEMSIKLR